LGAAAAFVLWKPPTFVSKARMLETVKLRLPEGSLFTEDVQNFLAHKPNASIRLRELAGCEVTRRKDVTRLPCHQRQRAPVRTFLIRHGFRAATRPIGPLINVLWKEEHPPNRLGTCLYFQVTNAGTGFKAERNPLDTFQRLQPVFGGEPDLRRLSRPLRTSCRSG
jgi:hypothetical protein